MDKILDFILASRPTLFILVGAVLVLFAASKGVSYGDWHFAIEESWSRIGVGIAGFVFVGLSFVKPEIDHLSDTAVAKLGIKIISPTEKAVLANKTNVRITTAKPIPKGYRLFVLRGYPTGGFVPNAELVPSADQKEWNAYDFDIGGVTNDARRIEAWVVGEDGVRLLDTWVAAQAVHKQVVNQLKKADPSAKIKWLDPIMEPARDMHRACWIPVSRA